MHETKKKMLFLIDPRKQPKNEGHLDFQEIKTNKTCRLAMRDGMDQVRKLIESDDLAKK